MRWRGWLLAALCPLLAAAPLARAAPAPAAWTASWGSAQMIPLNENALAPDALTDTTLRQVVRLSIGGDRLRVRVSNLFGTSPLAIAAAHVAPVAQLGTARIDVARGRALTFDGRADVVIPPGAELHSDPVALTVADGADLAISLYFPQAPAVQTGHPGSRSTSFLLRGNHVAAADLPGATTTARWYHLADVEVAAGRGAIVAIGDSITDGYGVQPERNTRWTDAFGARLREDPRTRGLGLVNAGIGGNRVLLDGLGPNLVARFDRDVLGRADVTHAILLEGINDLGVLTRDAPATPEAHAAIVREVTGAYRQLAARARQRGIKLIGGTIMPFGGNDYYHPGRETEASRQAINAFIRTAGVFDAVIDFDAVMRDPARPDRLNPAYDSGDHLHPSEAGYRAMAAAVPLDLFAPAAPAIALTFDDIPSHGPLPSGETRAAVMRAIVAALREASAPAHGFLNAGLGVREAGSAEAVKIWRDAGLPLGNHSFSHRRLDDGGVEDFKADVLRNEAPLAAAAGASDWRWFRYPYLAEGSDPATRDAVRSFLDAQGYRIAAVTMSFGDFNWNVPYARCLARDDQAAVAQLEATYLGAARAAALAMRAQSQQLHGRDIPYVLLMHVGAFDARMMPRLLSLYRDLGFRFVTLDEAQADPFYAAANDPGLPGPTSTLERAMRTAGLALPGPAPLSPEAKLCA